MSKGHDISNIAFGGHDKSHNLFGGPSFLYH